MWMVNVQYQTNFTTSFYILLPIVAATTANTAVHASNMSSFKSWPCACWSMYTNASCRYCIEKEKCKSNYKISEEFAFNKNPKRYTKYYVNFTRRRYKFIVIQTLNVFFYFVLLKEDIKWSQVGIFHCGYRTIWKYSGEMWAECYEKGVVILVQVMFRVLLLVFKSFILSFKLFVFYCIILCLFEGATF